MPVPSISFQVREYMRGRLNGSDSLPISSFNSNILTTAATYGVSPFSLNERASPPTLFLGRYDLANLVKAGLANAAGTPIAVLCLAKDDMVLSANIHSSHSLRMTPSTYSGPIYMSLDFYVQQVTQPVDGEALLHAVEDALFTTFNTQAAQSLIPAGVVYDNEIHFQPANLLWDGSLWNQHIPCVLVFYRFAT